MQHLPTAIVEGIDKLISLGTNDQEIATQFQTTVDVVRNIRLGRSWRWLTGRERIFPGKPRGERHGRRKLSAKQVLEILAAPPNYSQRKLAARFGVHRNTIAFIRTGKNWRHLFGNNKPQTAARQ